jgi:hypothetical protein
MCMLYLYRFIKGKYKSVLWPPARYYKLPYKNIQNVIGYL